MTDELDLDALVEEAASSATPTGGGGDFPPDYVTSSAKDGEMVPEGRHDVTIAHVQPYGTTPWGTESVSLVLKMDSNGRGWWDSLDFSEAGNPDRSRVATQASMRKLLALGYEKSQVVEMVRNRATTNWEGLKGSRVNVTVKHKDSSKGVTYANTYFNSANKEPETAAPPTADPAPAPQGQGHPLPSGLPTLG